MNDTKYYLKSNVQIEPLINHWHAYPFVVSPATAAMVLTNYQLPTMKSYLQMPMAHVAALKNPDMIGGPFIDHNGGRLKDIRALMNETEASSSTAIEFAKAIKQLNEILRSKATGHPLEELYHDIPEILQGYIELVYDLHHRPGYRFIERLLFKDADLYKPSHQSIALTEISSDKRSFIFSTPRLKDPKIVHLPFSFSDRKIDDLARLRREPASYNVIKKLFDISDDDDEIFQTFLSQEAPRQVTRFDQEGVRIRYFGHACTVVETRDVTIMTDPLISYKYESDIDRYTYEDLPEKIDYVVITHCHHDHIVLETLLQIRHKIRNIIVPRCGSGQLQDPSMKLILEAIGFDNVIEIDDMETIDMPGGSITGLPFYGEHCDLDIRSKSTYLLKLNQRSILLVADSSSINPAVYRKACESVGEIDVLFIGMECTGAPMSWSYGAFFTEPLDRALDQVRRSKGSDCDTALSLIDIFKPKHVYLYAMGSEPWLNYFMALQHSHSEATESESVRLIQECNSRGVYAESLFAKMEMIIDEALNLKTHYNESLHGR